MKVQGLPNTYVEQKLNLPHLTEKMCQNYYCVFIIILLATTFDKILGIFERI